MKILSPNSFHNRRHPTLAARSRHKLNVLFLLVLGATPRRYHPLAWLKDADVLPNVTNCYVFSCNLPNFWSAGATTRIGLPDCSYPFTLTREPHPIAGNAAAIRSPPFTPWMLD